MVATTKGVILKRRNIGENDVILTILTDEFGIIEASARGVKRPKSKLAAAVQPFCYSELSFFHSKDRFSVNNASAIENFYALRYDVVKVALADYLSELVCYLSPAGEQLDSVKRLYLNALYLLSQEKRGPRFIKAVCELRLLSLSGFMPDLVCCSECGAFEDVALYFRPEQGTLVCGNCIHASAADVKPLTPALLASLRHIIYAEDGKEFQFTVSAETEEKLASITEQYTLIHAERSFRPLEIYRSLISEENKT